MPTSLPDDARRNYLWRFALHYNRASKDPIRYGQLLEDPALFDRALEWASTSEDRELRELAEKLIAARNSSVEVDDDERMAPAEPSPRALANRTVWIGALAGALVIALALGLLGLWDDTATTPMIGQANAVVSDTVIQAATEASHVRGSIIKDTIWRSGQTYRLDSIVFVQNGATLRIEPGVRVLGSPRSALVVTQDARIDARGTREAPIVFTSAKPRGARARGDWGGVVLLGDAPINRPPGHIEGIDANDSRGRFGGSNPDNSCGVMRYVRIEFAGFEVFPDNELNGLTLGGCGRNTLINYVQVHRGLDDGIEVFGGNVDMKNIIVTGAKDDSFDWDMGWQGRVQFLIVDQYTDAGDNGFEADNWKQHPDAEPRSAPTIYNFTLLGSGSVAQAQRAMTLRRGTAGVFRNGIISGFRNEAIDIRDESAAKLIADGRLTLEHTILFDIGKDGFSYFRTEAGDKDDDGGVDENLVFRNAQRGNRFDTNPMFSAAITDLEHPDFKLPYRSPAREGGLVPPEEEFWDQSATFLGAMRPGGRDDWTLGWTEYPVD